MEVHVINLDRSKERLAEFAAVNGHLTKIVRFAAVDGHSADMSLLIERGLVGEDLVSRDYYTFGAVGAAMSHVSLWELAVKKNAALTISEDDAVFHSCFESLAPAVINSVPPNWDLILWGWNFDFFLCFEMLPGISSSLSQFDQDSLRENIEQFSNLPLSPRPFRLIWTFGLPCYTVTAKGARALLAKCLPLRPTMASFPPAVRVPPNTNLFRNVGIDLAMNNVYSQINAYVCFPPIVVTQNERGKSTVQEHA